MSFDWKEVFAVSEGVYLIDLPIGSLCALPDTNKSNKYWKTDKNNFKVYNSPIIMKKTREFTVQELMTDYPVRETEIDPTSIFIKVIPVEFIG